MIPGAEALYAAIQDTPLAAWLSRLPQVIERRFNEDNYGDLPKWLAVLAALPDIQTTDVDLGADTVHIGTKADCNNETRDTLTALLQQLHPWRKGPFDLFGVTIDTEWRSDLKWRRLQNHIEPLTGRLVLDVGCANGYHCLRMLGEGAAQVIGIEPLPLYTLQFQALKHYLGPVNAHVIPITLDALPQFIPYFDTVFSMGVLYHRRSPIDHLLELRDCLRPGGELVLETLVLEQEGNELLVPEARYAKMRNVWFIPSTALLATWLRRSGFRAVRVVSVSKTTPEEQRSTAWMRFESLPQFLHPDNPDQTVEGLPAPRRAIVIAQK